MRSAPLAAMSQPRPSQPARSVELSRLLGRPGARGEDLVVALADDLTVHDLLLVPSRDEAAVFEAGHQLVERWAALPYASRLQSLAHDAAGGRSQCEIGNDEELEVREARQRH